MILEREHRRRDERWVVGEEECYLCGWDELTGKAVECHAEEGNYLSIIKVLKVCFHVLSVIFLRNEESKLATSFVESIGPTMALRKNGLYANTAYLYNGFESKEHRYEEGQGID